MGVKDAGLRRRLETQLPFADQAALAGGEGSQARQPVAPLNAAARDGGSAGSGTPALPTGGHHA